ncbi:MAG: HlyD family efflux transporter periplasmic adaptor subunit [Flavobacteriales bacterium]|nr:HlyD family efflux transporter periplasmic adaptor subunit [Flavobacteriales bacterium]
MHPIVKNGLRFIAGMAILGVGLFVMNGLISLKEELPVSDRPVAPRAVRVWEIRTSECTPLTPIEGRVEAKYRMDVMSEATGNLLMGGKEFREGTSFQMGEVMLALDDSETRTSLVAQRSQFLQLLSVHLADLRFEFPNQRSQWDAFVDGISVEQLLPNLPVSSSQREQLFLANRGVLASYYGIRSAEERLSKFTIRAPFDGTVTTATVRPGALVRSGQMAGTLVGGSEYEVKTAVHTRYLSTVRRGDSVVFKNENEQIIAVGTVHRLSGNVDAATQSASVFCRVNGVPEVPEVLRDGRFISGEIRSESIADAIEIPNAWIDAEHRVYIVVNDTLRSRAVNVLFQSRKYSIVQGLEEGTALLSEVLASSFDGMAVTPELAEPFE